MMHRSMKTGSGSGTCSYRMKPSYRIAYSSSEAPPPHTKTVPRTRLLLCIQTAGSALPDIQWTFLFLQLPHHQSLLLVLGCSLCIKPLPLCLGQQLFPCMAFNPHHVLAKTEDVYSKRNQPHCKQEESLNSVCIWVTACVQKHVAPSDAIGDTH